MMRNFVADLISDDRCGEVMIATGYWDLPGMTLLLPQLREFLSREGATLQLLIGSDPIVKAAQQKNPLTKDARFPQDYIKRDIQELEVTDALADAVTLIKEYCHEDEEASKLKIRIYKSDENGDAQFFHAKCYVFCGTDFCNGIIGSSNFTRKGLEGNSELNHLETSNTLVAAVPNEYAPQRGHRQWFLDKWALSTPWNKEFLLEVLKGTKVEARAEEKEKEAEAGTPLTPYELYIKLLNYKFGDVVDLGQQKILESYLPENFNPIDYQLQAVKQCFTIMREHGGFMLADVVGLGKTVVGTLIIKHYLSLPDNDGRERSVLVITPPAIKSAWVETIQEFDKKAKDKMEPLVDFVTTGSIGNLLSDDSYTYAEDEEEEGDGDGEKEGDGNVDASEVSEAEEIVEADDSDEQADSDFAVELENKNYGLIIIDESHKFRNRQTSMYKALDTLIGQIGSTTGAYPYVGLLSATPQNNRPADIQSQVYLFERNHTDSTLKKADGGNLESFFKAVNKAYKELMAPPRDKNGNPVELTPELIKERNERLKTLSRQVRDCVLEDILVRRTRTDIAKYYPDSGLKFPSISGPHSLEYKMEDELAKLFSETMNLIVPMSNFKFDNSNYLCYYRHRAIEFIKDPEVREIYSYRNLNPVRISQQLAKIMQILLVKRIESSFPAFKTSLRNLRKNTQNMIDMWENNTIFICPDFDVNAELDPKKWFERTHVLRPFDDCVEDIRKKINKLTAEKRNETGRNREMTSDEFSDDYIKLLRQDLVVIDLLCDKWADYSVDPKIEVFKQNLLGTLFDKQRNPAQKLVIFSEAIDTVNAIKQAIGAVAPKLKVLVITAKNRKERELTIRENFDANYKGEKKDDYQVIVTTEVLAEGINLHRANCILNYDTPWNSTRLMQRIGRVNRIGSTADTVYVYNFMPSAQGDAQIKLVQKAHNKIQSFHTLFGEDSQVFTNDEEVAHYDIDLNSQVNGEESPLEKYISELRNYKTAHPERFEQIVATEEGLEMGLAAQEGTSYFVVRNRATTGMFVSVGADLKPHMLSGAEACDRFRPAAEDMEAGPLPADWEARKAKAELAVNQAMHKMNIHGNSQKATQAKAIIMKMKNEMKLSKESESLLASAFNFVNKGNFDIINKIIAISEAQADGQPTLFKMTQKDVDDILNREIKQIASRVQERAGKAQVYMGMSK